ncbi:MAG: energy-coupling factor transporter transmembrane protein EcfT [Ruminococcaceae bacterium]|nr:energy-coupling factor transporter transmembrane protein EcfT [Oscillospiraceae bacterium]
MLVMNPISLGISLMCGFLYSLMLGGKASVRKNLIFVIPLMFFTAVLNPLFNHRGVTILWYFPGGNPLTAESIIFGAVAAVMLASVIFWFSCFNRIFTSDKLMYLFGKVSPALSLILSMTLRFVPRFSGQIKKIITAQRCIGKDQRCGKVTERIKNGGAVLSAMTSWALEGSVITADSMKARGYGLSGRTAFSPFRFTARDFKFLLVIVLLGTYTALGATLGELRFWYFPSFGGKAPTGFSISVYAAYFILCGLPLIIDLWEVRRWNSLRSKI